MEGKDDANYTSLRKNPLKKYDLMVKHHCSVLNGDWCNGAQMFYDTLHEMTDFTTDLRKSQKNIDLFPEILKEIAFSSISPIGRLYSTKDIKKRFNLDLRTAQRYLNKLSKLRWLAIAAGYNYRILNPFFELLIRLCPKSITIIDTYSAFQIDLLDIYSYPLLLALKDNIKKVDFIWSHFDKRFPYFPEKAFQIGFLNEERIRLYWNGLLQIKAQGIKTYYAILPYNIHWTGKNCHITLPIPWRFYGVDSCCHSKSGLKIHFDNSIKISIPLNNATYYNSKKMGKSHFTYIHAKFLEKYWKNEYVECWNFESHEKAIRDRLIDKKIPIEKFQNKQLFMKGLLKRCKQR